MERLPWHHKDLLRRASDPLLRHRYRALQSWYREELLGADYGEYRGSPVGNRLAPLAVAANRGLNFYEGVVEFAEETVRQVRPRRGTLQEERLFHNMLSSMPLCFNIFGALRDRPELTYLLRRALELPVAEVTEVACEWAPRKEEALGDLTAFDAFVRFRSESGGSCFIGIETKYTDPFSPRPYAAERYREASDRSGWIAPGAAEALSGSRTNQLWRNVLLAATLSNSGEFDEGWSAVLFLEADKGAWAAREALNKHLLEPERVRWCTYEKLIDTAKDIDGLTDWADWFERRYLDLTPVQAALGP